MSFDATVLQILIASPSDVSDKRNEIEKQIFEWNKQYAEELKVVLLPKRWEDVAPAYSTGDPQQILNEKLVEKCDILIGVFWTKLGTPTARDSSGTLEEISICIDKGKEIMLYFLNDPVPMEVINSKEKLEEFNRVLNYKNEYGQKGLYSYETARIKEHLFEKVLDYKRKSGASNSGHGPQQSVFIDEKTEELVKVPNIRETIPEESSVTFSSLFKDGGLKPAEILLLGYIIDTGDRSFGYRGMAKNTIEKIRKWEVDLNLKSSLTTEYETVIKNLADRNILEEEHTGPGNARLYSLPMNLFNELRKLPPKSKRRIDEFIDGYVRIDNTF